MELFAEFARVLEIAAGDAESAREGMHLDWPPEIVKGMNERLALKATMERVIELVAPQRAKELRDYYKEQLAGAEWDGGPMPQVPMLPETDERMNEFLEILRRRRLFDRELDAACRWQR